jgi:glycerol-3-phosphate acyltransferase PlsY
MNQYLLLFSGAIAYLIGSISFSRLVTFILASGKDITDHEFSVDGTGDTYKVLSIGANSVSSLLGTRAGFVVSILDILKVFLPTIYLKIKYPDQPAVYFAAAVFGVVGHIWPVYNKFHGGSGFTAIMGGLLVIDWPAIFITPILGLVLGLFVLRNLVVATLSWIWLLIPWMWWRMGGDPEFIYYSVAINVLFILAMIPEIKTAMKYREQGKYLEYGIGSLKSHPMGRGMLKMANRLNIEVK